eukprot:TRINITY_DN13092_c0_g1_i1.p1 TRINITY_DN13092_c0_g1~~TRINITY_DN13092_c0_g1_i1.p1  ORF type:complete len:125 (-),score=38.02 TRINITY_DN13092_c0_g1_i1:104-478(-)
MCIRDRYQRRVHGKMADAFTMQHFNAGDVVIREGDQGNSFYIIEEGFAEARKRNKQGKEEVVLEYKEGDYFGELALLRNEPRAATIAAKTPLNVFVLDRDAFARILGPLDELLRRNAEKYKKFL